MRMNSIKYQQERKKSPILSKTTVTKPPLGKQVPKPRIAQVSMPLNHRSGGFYMKNKPARSPGTSDSSNKSNNFLGGNKYGHK